MAAVTILCFFSFFVIAVSVGCFALFLCFMAYVHYVHRINGHLPGPPRSSFIFGHLPEIRKYKNETGKTLVHFLLEKRLQYGPIFVIFFAHIPIVYVGDSSYVRHVFINNHKILYKSAFFYHKMGFVYGERVVGYGLATNTDEASWRTRRRLVNPAFHRKCLRDFIRNFNDVCNRFLARMDDVASEGNHTSMVQEFAKVTLEAISQVSFNINTHAIESSNSPFPKAIRSCLRGIQDNLEMPISPTLLAIFQFRLLQNDRKREQIDAIRFLRKFSSECIATRMKEIGDGKDVPNDLLSFLIKDESLSMDEKIDEFLTIFIAGQETTANSLSFTLYEIIKNPHVQVKLLTEFKEVLGEREDVVFDDLAKLKYLGQVLNESYRKHPVAFGPSRVLADDITVGGYHIPKGNGVNTVQLFFGMNPEIWKNPEIFDPERFSSAENMPNFSMTHFPFSMGPRNCIGQTFAKFESKIILAKLLRKFEFQLLPGQTDQCETRLTLTPKDGVICSVTKRESL